MQEHPHDSQRPQLEQTGWNFAAATTPPSRRRRTNRIILIVAGSIFAFFVALAAIGAALGKDKPSATPAAAATPSATAAKTSVPTPAASSPAAASPTAEASHIASQAARTKAASVLTMATNHYANVFAQGQAIVGRTQYTDGDAGLAALQDPNSAASKFSAWRQSSKVEQDVNTYQDAFSQADANFDASDEPASISTWRDDLGTAQGDIAQWVQTAVAYQISSTSQADLDTAAAKVQTDLKTVRADIAAVQAGK